MYVAPFTKAPLECFVQSPSYCIKLESWAITFLTFVLFDNFTSATIVISLPSLLFKALIFKYLAFVCGNDIFMSAGAFELPFLVLSSAICVQTVLSPLYSSAINIS